MSEREAQITRASIVFPDPADTITDWLQKHVPLLPEFLALMPDVAAYIESRKFLQKLPSSFPVWRTTFDPERLPCVVVQEGPANPQQHFIGDALEADREIVDGGDYEALSGVLYGFSTNVVLHTQTPDDLHHLDRAMKALVLSPMFREDMHKAGLVNPQASGLGDVLFDGARGEPNMLISHAYRVTGSYLMKEYRNFKRIAEVGVTFTDFEGAVVTPE